jgi:hypothetical protein
MSSVVVYESVYGNTRAVAEAIAEGLGDAQAVPVHCVGDEVSSHDLVVVGGPTHMHGLATAASRKAAVQGAMEDGETHVEANATGEPGLRTWLHELPHADRRLAAAFDTRIDRSPVLTGSAARGIGRRLRRRGYDVLETESFFVTDSEGPLDAGEVDRAREWGALLAVRLSAPGVACG